MPQKKTYIYHMQIGQDDKVEVDCFVAAGNAGIAVDYCKEVYREKKYNSYKANKVGAYHEKQKPHFLESEDEYKLRQAGADKGNKYSEREIERPRFVTKEEAGELGL